MGLDVPRAVVPGSCACSTIDQECICAPWNLLDVKERAQSAKYLAVELEQQGRLDEAERARHEHRQLSAQLQAALTPKPRPTARKDTMPTEPTTLTTANTIKSMSLADAIKHRPSSAIDPRMLLAIAAKEAGLDEHADYWERQTIRRDWPAWPPGITREQAVEKIRGSGARLDAADLERDPYVAGGLVRILEREVRDTGKYPLASGPNGRASDPSRRDGDMVTWPDGWGVASALAAITEAGLTTNVYGVELGTETPQQFVLGALMMLLAQRDASSDDRADQRDRDEIKRQWDTQHLATLKREDAPRTEAEIKQAWDEQHRAHLAEHREAAEKLT